MSRSKSTLGGLNIHQSPPGTKLEASGNPSAGLEYWKPIPGYEGLYEVSDLGAVRRVKVAQRTYAGRVMKQSKNARGYPVVGLSRDSRQVVYEVHRLVAAAFLGPKPREKEVDHLDADRMNPRRSNLEYVSHAENMRRARLHRIARYDARARAEGTVAL